MNGIRHGEHQILQAPDYYAQQHQNSQQHMATAHQQHPGQQIAPPLPYANMPPQQQYPWGGKQQ